MNDKGKARKLDDYTAGPVPAGPRGSQAASLPPLGRPGMVHPHANYGLAAEGFHSAGGRLTYSHGGLTQLMQMNRGGDLGPPLFMPALNLGTPKPPSITSSSPSSSAPTAHSSAPAAFTNSSKQKASLSTLSSQHQQIITTTSPYVTDMMSYPHATPLSPFHAGPPLKPVSYIPPTSATIPKPTPISVTHTSTKNPITRVISGGSGPTMDKHSTTAPTKPVPVGGGLKQGSHTPGSSDVVMVKGEGHGGLQYQSGGRYSSIQGSGDVATSSLAKILSTSSSQMLTMASSAATLVRSAASYSAALNDVYSARSPLMAPLNPATSGQPTSNNILADTRIDRPPQPSAPNPPQPASSLGNQKDFKDAQRPTTAEVASSIIISNPGLTGKHIAAMTNTTQQQQQAPPTSAIFHHHHHHPGMVFPSSASSITSPSTSQPSPVVPPELLQPGAAASMLNLPPTLPQQLVGGGSDVVAANWTYSSQHHNSNHHMFPSPSGLTSTATPGSPLSSSSSTLGGSPAPPAVGGAGKDGSSQQQQQHSNGFKPRLEPTNVHQSPLVSGAVQTSGVDIGLLTSPGQGTNSSPRPRILRGKRNVDGSWKLDGPANTLNSPGSPHKTKLYNLKKTINSPCGGGADQTPCSPSSTVTTSNSSSSAGDTGGRVLNHVTGGVRSDGSVTDLYGSPRKKPRKQNVVANDDQYASNVPDTHDEATNVSSTTEVKGHQGPGLVDMDGDNMKEVEVCYLAQLRRSQYPINGIYKLSHNSAHNHFRKHSDVKHRDDMPVSPYELANDRTAHQRAGGWKLQHFSSQLQEQVTTEEGILGLMESIQTVLDAAEKKPDCLLNDKALSSTKELLQGNIDRSNRISAHINSTRNTMFSVLDHRPQVMDILDKYSDFKSRCSSISPSLSSSSSSHHPRSH